MDLTAPTVSYPEPPAALKVFGPNVFMMPVTTDTDIVSYSATGFPSWVQSQTNSLFLVQGWIIGTTDAANPDSTTVTVTVTDTAGNPAVVTITFPPVDKGDQNLGSFYYSPRTVALGGPAPTLNGPSGAHGTVSYSATPEMVCTVDAMSGALTLVGVGDCVVTATAEATANYNGATADATVIVQLPPLVLNVAAIAGGNTVNIAEHAAGFAISGDTGSEAGVLVTVTVGGTELTATSGDDGAWSVEVPEDAAYLTEISDSVTVSATKTGFTPGSVTRTLVVDLTAPAVTYPDPPATLKVGASVVRMRSVTTDADIASYSAPGLPSWVISQTNNLFLQQGFILGNPDTANSDSTTVKVTVTDTAGNTAEVTITFPPVDKGDQNLGSFYYSPRTVTFGDLAPSVTGPFSARTTVRYSAMPAEVCMVDMATGELTIQGAGTCEITATAESDDDYNGATRTTTVTVEGPTLALTLDAIAGDDVVNIAEKATGFTISGDTGTEAGVSVTVTVARGDAFLPTAPATELAATSVAGGTWSVDVPANAAYIGESSLAVRVSASKAGFASPSEVTRRIAVDLAGPYLIYFDRFINLKVGALATVHLGGTSARSFRATGLPSWLSIDPESGVISGTPDAVDPNPFDVRVMATDSAGNTAEVTVAFPAVAKGDQDLAGFAYTPATLTFGSTTPTVTAPTGVPGTVSYTAMPAGVCTVDDANGALTLAGPGTCTITATAAGTANYNAAMADATVTVLASGTLALTVDPIAGDDTVNIVEKAGGFTISGATGSEAGVTVSVTIGTQSPQTVTSAAGGAWSVPVSANAAYITGTSVTVTVSASKTGFLVSPGSVTRTLAVDLIAPSQSYDESGTEGVPLTLRVGTDVQIYGYIAPNTEYYDGTSHSATGLPSGLRIDRVGFIEGVPDTANPASTTATVRVTDPAGNFSEVMVTFPPVDKGDQSLGRFFSYRPSTVTVGDPAPWLRAPTGAQGTVSYTATPAEVCTVDTMSGALTLVGGWAIAR